MPKINIHTIIYTCADAEREDFPTPEERGSFLDLKRARDELDRLIEEEKKKLDERYNSEDRTENWWEAYMDGFYPGIFSRIEILTSELMDGSDR